MKQKDSSRKETSFSLSPHSHFIIYPTTNIGEIIKFYLIVSRVVLQNGFSGRWEMEKEFTGETQRKSQTLRDKTISKKRTARKEKYLI